MTVRNYDPEDYMLVFAGRTITGLADGTPITAGKDANRWETHVGAQGGFNPILVQFKRKGIRTRTCSSTCFNPILVQFKPISCRTVSEW